MQLWRTPPLHSNDEQMNKDWCKEVMKIYMNSVSWLSVWDRDTVLKFSLKSCWENMFRLKMWCIFFRSPVDAICGGKFSSFQRRLSTSNEPASKPHVSMMLLCRCLVFSECLCVYDICVDAAVSLLVANSEMPRLYRVNFSSTYVKSTKSLVISRINLWVSVLFAITEHLQFEINIAGSIYVVRPEVLRLVFCCK